MSCLREGEREESQAAFKIALSIDPLQPAWVKRAVSALHREVVELHGVVLSVPVRVVSPLVLSHLVKGNYEGRELSLLQQCLKSDDRILELGAGLGFLACFVGRAHPDIPYIAIEANPQLIPVIRENFKLNNCGIQLLHGAAAVTNDTILFHVADDFWASSIENIAHLHTDMEVPGIDIQPIMEDLKPTLLIIDIEGGELNLVPQLNLTCVDRLLIELHPDIYGNEGSNRIIKSLLDQKFYLDVQNSGTQVFLFVRS
jgi:FkbM family methyltransferase